MNPAQVLSIAGSDSGGGAGIQADLKTFQMRGVFGTSVLTAVTAQNTLGVHHIHLLPCDSIHAQIRAIAEDFDINACKIGMLGTAAIIECVADALQSCRFGTLVLDPVMVAKGGAPLLQADAVAALKRYLLPRVDVITPNLPETERLTGIAVHNQHDARRAAAMLQDWGAQTVVIKGGHAQGSTSRDWVFMPDGVLELAVPRIDTVRTHGTGCTFSACIAAELAKGRTTEQAVRTAKQFITAAIANPINVGSGHGPVNHWADRDSVGSLNN